MTNCTTVIYNSAIFFFKFRLLRISSGWACHSMHKPIPNIVDKVFYRLYLPIRTRHVIMLTAVPSVALHASVVKQQNWVMHVTYLSPHCPQIPVLIFTARRVCIARTIPSQDVCLSVCLSHAGILSTSLNISSKSCAVYRTAPFSTTLNDPYTRLTQDILTDVISNDLEWNIRRQSVARSLCDTATAELLVLSHYCGSYYSRPRVDLACWAIYYSENLA